MPELTLTMMFYREFLNMVFDTMSSSVTIESKAAVFKHEFKLSLIFINPMKFRIVVTDDHLTSNYIYNEPLKPVPSICQ